MTPRPWRWRLHDRLELLTDRLRDLPDTRWRRINDLPFKLVDAVKRLVCLVLGHLPEEDHCGIPAHDQCAYCRKAMPGQAAR